MHKEKYAGNREEKGCIIKHTAFLMEKNLPQRESITRAASLHALLNWDFAIKSDYCYQQEAGLAVLLQGESSKSQISQHAGWGSLAHVHRTPASPCLRAGEDSVAWLNSNCSFRHRIPDSQDRDTLTSKSWRTREHAKGPLELSAWTLSPQVSPWRKAVCFGLL